MGTAGAISAALALLPGLVAALIALVDLAARSVLGLSGLLFVLATGPGGATPGADLPSYVGPDRAVLEAAIGLSLARAVPGALLCAIAIRPPRWRGLRAACLALSLAGIAAAASTPSRIAAIAALAGAVAISGPD